MKISLTFLQLETKFYQKFLGKSGGGVPIAIVPALPNAKNIEPQLNLTTF